MRAIYQRQIEDLTAKIDVAIQQKSALQDQRDDTEGGACADARSGTHAQQFRP